MKMNTIDKFPTFTYLKIFFGLEEIPHFHEYIGGYELFPRLDNYPRSYYETDSQDYLYKKSKTIYLAQENEIDEFIKKLTYLTNHFDCQVKFKNKQRSPFIEILSTYSEKLILSSDVDNLLKDFSDWESEVLSVKDTILYKVYCSFYKSLLQYKKMIDSNSGLIAAKIQNIMTEFPLENIETIPEIIKKPFKYIQIPFNQEVFENRDFYNDNNAI